MLRGFVDQGVELFLRVTRQGFSAWTPRCVAL
jgi:hypothetical protein